MNAFDTAQLLGVVDGMRQFAFSSFVLDTFFPSATFSDAEEIAFDKIAKKRRLAAFVSPFVAGKVNRQDGQSTTFLKPAYIKEKDEVTPSRTLKRRAGEPFGAGAMSPEQRRGAIIADILLDHQNKIRGRKAWMAWKALIGGKYTVSAENYPAIEVDFGRDNALSKSLTSGARWSQTSATPMTDIENWAGDIQAKSGGAVARDVIMDPKAWAYFRSFDAVTKVLDNRRQASGNVELGPIQRDPNSRVRFGGTIGDFDFWIYQESYIDDAGAAANMIPDNSVIMAARADLEGIQAHGAILDNEVLRAMEYFPKMWNENDPSRTLVMTQSAPLIVPANVNASLYALVHQ